MATDGNGAPVSPIDKEAICFCAAGAIMLSAHRLDSSDQQDECSPCDTAIQLLDQSAPGGSFLNINDGIGIVIADSFSGSRITPHQAILQVFDRAIEAAG